MTGVLPIPKYSSGSGLNMFEEYNVLNDDEFDAYFGFTENEVETLCAKQNKLSIEEIRDWYNGYRSQNGLRIYNPWSTSIALDNGYCDRYWASGGPMDEIVYYIRQGESCVINDIVSMLLGEPVKIRLKGYAAEKPLLSTRNQILSAMTIYGLLCYYNEELTIPNKELRMRFDDDMDDDPIDEVSKILMESHEMMQATVNKDTETMERLLQDAHDIYTSIIKYYDENPFANMITLLYIKARDKYRIIRDMPGGAGFADFAFFPKDQTEPAFIIEVKKDASTKVALSQIKSRRYYKALLDYSGRKLIIAMTYDSKSKQHHVEIEEIFRGDVG
jgi:hypothetical protein